MINLLVNRIKDMYFDLDRDTARRARFYADTQAITPGAIQLNPSQQQAIMQDLGQQEMQQQAMAQQMPQDQMAPQAAAQPQPQMQPPSLLDQLAARR